MEDLISRREFMEKSAKFTAAAALTNFNIITDRSEKNYDLLIKSGLVYDGLGNKAKELDLAIKGDKIFMIDKNISEKMAKRVINAKGSIISPGFIDVHNHTDTNVLVNPKAESMIRQGVTTLFSGNCGDSPFPIPESEFEDEKKRLKERYDIELIWRNADEYLTVLEKKETSVNHATFLGQGALRGAFVGQNDKEPTQEELKNMKQYVEDSMRAGVLGLSTGLEYTPGSFAKTAEIIELCKIVSRYNGVYATHMRNEDDTLIEAIQESIKIAKLSKVSLQISHLKTCYPRNWHKIDLVIKEIETAKKEGIKILADRYPYIAYSTGLSMCFPLWVREGTHKEFIEKLTDKKIEEKLREEIRKKEVKFGSWDKVMISNVSKEKNRNVLGKNVFELSKAAGKAPFEFIRDLLVEDGGNTSMIVFAMNEDNLKRLLAHQLVIVGSDGSAIAPYGLLGKGNPHPRNYGTFPRAIRKYCLDEKIFPMETVLQKITSTPAKKFGIQKRGIIKQGYYADLTIFNPDKISDASIWTNPHQYANGIDNVIVNGQITVEMGEHTGALAGKVLRKKG